MMANVAWSWAAHLVFVISGFVMPHMLDRNLGQDLLGIWDLCWSLVSYLSLAGLGTGASVNRYVARYRAAGDVDSLCRAVSSVVALQVLVCVFVVLATLGIVFALPMLVNDRVGVHLEETRWVVLFLGLSLAVQKGLEAYRGVISGCHRWDLHNGIQAGSHAVSVVAMLTSLLMGGGVVSMAIIYFIGTSLGEMARVVAVAYVCPELKVRWHFVGWDYGRKLALFGGKIFLLGTPPLVLYQTVNIYVASALGPAMLAVLSRPLGLVRHAETLLAKFSNMFSPMAGSIQGSDERAQQRELLYYGARWGVAVAMPASIGLAVLGDSLIELWMGADYVHPGLMALLAIGMFPQIAHASAVQILVGMNLHGRAAIFSMVWVGLALLVGVVIFSYVGWSLNGAALLLVAAMAPSYGIFLPGYLCHLLGVSFSSYFRRVLVLPLVTGAALTVALMAVRLWFAGRPLMTVLVGTLVGCGLTAAIYWRYLLTPGLRARVLGLLGRRGGKTDQEAV
ncbi:MAG: hypothetical protein IPM70_16450 [Proteobacteria bacterium]|nr:hypothetical protein [Pseudomonadota bacterium]